MLKIIKTILFLCMIFFVGVSAYAVPITLTFRGEIIENYSGQIEYDVGTKFTLSLSYNTTFNDDLNPEEDSGVYHSMFQQLDLMMAFSTNTSIQSSINDNAQTMASVTVENNYNGNEYDKFSFNTSNAAVGDFDNDTMMYGDYCSLSFDLIDSMGDVFINDLLPEELYLHDFDPESLFINSDLFKGKLVASPEPMTIVLMGSGLFGFFVSRKKRK